MPPTWSPVTLRDAIGRGDTVDAADPLRRLRARWLTGPYAVPEPVVTPQGLAERPVRCDCGRSRPPSMLLDVRALPLGLRRFGVDGEPQDFACDVCRSLLRRLGLVTRAELASLMGAPAARVAAIAARWGTTARPVGRIVADLVAAGLTTASRDVHDLRTASPTHRARARARAGDAAGDATDGAAGVASADVSAPTP